MRTKKEQVELVEVSIQKIKGEQRKYKDKEEKEEMEAEEIRGRIAIQTK